MRWLTIDPTNRREAAYRAEKLKAIDAWWREFEARSDDISAHFADVEMPGFYGWMDEFLGAVDKRLTWEFGPAVSGQGDRLVITPEAEHWLRPLVGTLLERAPKLKNWEFYPYRLPLPFAVAMQTVKSRTDSDLSEARVTATLEHGKINLHFVLPNCEGPLDAKARSAAFMATEHLIGEEILDAWIGEISVSPPPRRGLLGALRRSEGGQDLLPLEVLLARVDDLVETLRSRIPDSPSFRVIDDRQWSSCTFEPKRRDDDYPRRSDLLVAVTTRPELIDAAHGSGLFHSNCFSRHGEMYCYLKIDGGDGLSGSRFEDRGDIEDALNAALIPAEAGCVIGGGTGLRYSYVDLALMHLSSGRQLVRDVLLEAGIPIRTWLLFFDTSLAREWVGVHDDCPPPPGEGEA